MSACVTCGAESCANPGFCAACRKADQRKARGEQPRHIDSWCNPPAHIPHDWQTMSIDRLWQLLTLGRSTPQTTIEAVIYCVGERGLGALDEPASIERLSRCDKAARVEINHRIDRLIEQKGSLR